MVTSLSETTIAKKLRGASGNTLLRNLFTDDWPAGYPAGQVREENLYREVALCLGVDTKLVRIALDEANGNMLARNAVADAIAVLLDEVVDDTPARSTRPPPAVESGGASRNGRQVARTRVFVSYSHKDARWLERLKVHLAPLLDDGRLALWDDTRIAPGAKWEDEINRALAEARVAVMLVSADFLASQFIRKKEVPPLLAAAASDGAVILPIIVGPSLFTQTPSLSRFQAVNPPEQPLIALSRPEQERVWARVAERIRSLFPQAP